MSTSNSSKGKGKKRRISLAEFQQMHAPPPRAPPAAAEASTGPKKKRRRKKKAAPRPHVSLPALTEVDVVPGEPIAVITRGVEVASDVELLTARSAVAMVVERGDDDESKTAATTRTQNGALCFVSSGNACLDLFYKGMLRDAPPHTIAALMADAWAESPATALAILLHGRDIRDGKGERRSPLEGMKWLRQNAPMSYALNLRAFLAHGCYRDLLSLAADLPVPCTTLTIRDALELEVLAWDLEKEPQSLAAKWAPSRQSAFDQQAALASRTARLLFPGSATASADYRRMLSAARERLHVTERLLCTGRVDEVKFQHVPALAHAKWKRVFATKRSDDYAAYIQRVKSGKATIKSKGLAPHDLVGPYLRGSHRCADPTVEAQWRALVADLRSKGRLSSCLSIVDVSGSMMSTCRGSSVRPLDVAVALGTLTAILCRGPFHGRVLTFSETPQWHVLGSEESSSLHRQVTDMSRMHWGMNTDIAAAFQLILSTAVSCRARQDELPSVLFVYSDMQFDESVRGGHQLPALRRAFAEHGYTAPQVVFWNLSGSASAPVRATDDGVALLSGFSGELLRMFMDGEAQSFTPLSIMRKALQPYAQDVRVAKNELLN